MWLLGGNSAIPLGRNTTPIVSLSADLSMEKKDPGAMTPPGMARLAGSIADAGGSREGEPPMGLPFPGLGLMTFFVFDPYSLTWKPLFSIRLP